MKALLAGALGLCLAAGSANSAVVFSFVQDAGGVTGTLSGTLDLTDMFPIESGFIETSRGIFPDDATLVTGATASLWEVYGGVSGPLTWGSGLSQEATATTGSNLGILFDRDMYLLVPQGFAGGSLSGSLSFAGSTLASLGVIPGTYVYGLPHDTVTVSFGPAPIPLPAPLLLLAGALGLAALPLARRRRTP